MNLYILVEDGKSGHKIIDHWIPLLLPTLTRAPTVNDVSENQYVIFSGLGYPRMLGTNPSSPSKNVLGQTIDTINACQKFDYLLIFLDGDNEGETTRIEEVTQKINNYAEPLSCPFVVFVQNKCLETWLLGNREMFPIQPTQAFLPFLNHYNVADSDPELMKNNTQSKLVSTDSLYHERYLRAMLKEKGYYYSKSRPAEVIYTKSYLDALKERTEETSHLVSLHHFFQFIDKLTQTLS